MGPLPEPEAPELFIVPSNCVELQNQDFPLKPLYAKCVTEAPTVDERGKEVFVKKGERLFRRSGLGDQLAVPQSLRATVLDLSHSAPWAGHLGQAKTYRMIGFTGLSSMQTLQYCKSCPQC